MLLESKVLLGLGLAFCKVKHGLVCFFDGMKCFTIIYYQIPVMPQSKDLMLLLNALKEVILVFTVVFAFTAHE